MRWFHDRTIAAKLLIGFGIVLALMLALGAVAFRSMAQMRAASEDLAANWLPSVRTVMSVRADVGELRRWQLAHLLMTEASGMRDYEGRMQVTLAQFETDRKAYEGLISSPEERAGYERFAALWTSFMAGHERMLALSRAGSKADAVRYSTTESARVLAELYEQLGKLVALNSEGADRSAAAVEASSRAATLTMAVTLAAAVAAGIGLALWLARMVAAPLRAAVGLAEQVAQGDLSHHIEASTACEVGQLMGALGHMTGRLRELVGEVGASSATIAGASGQIASGNQDLSARTEQQASALEETASSMEELTSTVRQNAANARDANRLAQGAATVARKGGGVMEQMAATMASIDASSRKIVDIIAVVDGIAFQTNILALNAAVEAARAGEQGRGFAVVASEVRSLAQRSAAAAKDIKDLIDDSVGKVDAGGRLVRDAGATMRDVVDEIARVGTLMDEIARASAEQSSGIEQVSQAIVHMDEATQQNAALVEEAAAAAVSMQEQAARLQQLVGAFRLDGRQAGSRLAPRPDAAPALRLA